uniref:Uncharacterized protein n=1 Tax=Photinus pyralis TaxID=7054 RepID=A0A1Y1K9E7_PHOPY
MRFLLEIYEEVIQLAIGINLRFHLVIPQRFKVITRAVAGNSRFRRLFTLHGLIFAGFHVIDFARSVFIRVGISVQVSFFALFTPATDGVVIGTCDQRLGTFATFLALRVLAPLVLGVRILVPRRRPFLLLPLRSALLELVEFRLKLLLALLFFLLLHVLTTSGFNLIVHRNVRGLVIDNIEYGMWLFLRLIRVGCRIRTRHLPDALLLGVLLLLGLRARILIATFSLGRRSLFLFPILGFAMFLAFALLQLDGLLLALLFRLFPLSHPLGIFGRLQIEPRQKILVDRRVFTWNFRNGGIFLSDLLFRFLLVCFLLMFVLLLLVSIFDFLYAVKLLVSQFIFYDFGYVVFMFHLNFFVTSNILRVSPIRYLPMVLT